MYRRKLGIPFRLTFIAAAMPWAVQMAHANNKGIGLASDGATPIPTYYANTYVQDPAFPTDPTKVVGLRKFVDSLPGLTPANANNLGQYLPVAVADKATYPGSDYYEIAVVEYAEKVHSDLPKATTLRGYVQLSKTATGKTVTSNGQSYDVVDNPHYLGPVIVAQRNRPVRIKFANLLPAGKAVQVLDANGRPVTIQPGSRNGDLFIPVDTGLPGAGVGPDGMTQYNQNRQELHLHGGDNPWISDGTPHQWILPAVDESAFLNAGQPEFARGASTKDVPDMRDINNPEPGAVTYFWPNGQGARLMFYHDHTSGITRLNVYAGAAAGYLLTDPAAENQLTAAGLPTDQIPLIIQDKTFVPSDIAAQDVKWDQEAWGKPGDLWYPHVYETNQDPNSPDGSNPVGRWDWGPWFWPVFPSLYNLPTGDYGDVSTTPEAFMDTPVVNGTAYPTLKVEPKAYRFRILNASNDRMINLGLYVAADKKGIDVNNVTGSTPALCNGAVPVSDCTEVKMVNFDSTGTFPSAGGLNGTGWGQPDQRAGGVPDPATAGPNIIQIGNEGGFLPKPAVIPPTPINYEYNKRSITVLNILEHGLFMGPAERADAVIDFSQYAGKTLLLYNDGPAPVPAADPRLDYYTGNPDFSNAGGAPTTQPGYGPNTRTVMQIVVAPNRTDLGGITVTKGGSGYNPATPPKVTIASADGNGSGATAVAKVDPNTGAVTAITLTNKGTGYTAPPAITIAPPQGFFDTQATATATLAGTNAFDPNGDGGPLATALPVAFKASQNTPIVAQAAYNALNPTCETDPATCWADQFASIFTGTLQQPTFSFTPGASSNLAGIVLLDGGSGYITPPQVTMTDNTGGGGAGASAVAYLKIGNIAVTNPGTGYSSAPTVRINTINNAPGTGATASAALKVVDVKVTAGGSGYVSPPTVTFAAPPTGGTRATGTAIVSGGKVTGIQIDNPGSGYTLMPTIAFNNTGTGGTGAKATAVGGVGAVTLTALDPNNPGMAGGMGYTDMSQVTVNFSSPVGTGAAATVTGSVGIVHLIQPGTGYPAPAAGDQPPANSNITVGFSGGLGAGGVSATATASTQAMMAVQNKAIQELFEPTFGRMNATLGIEMPFTSATAQTTIPLNYIDPTTETFSNGETQIWKITHNGVDTHPVHFHLLNVQLINRVGWDGTVKPPKANEVGWKETVRMNPLEDVIVAVRAKKPELKGVGGSGFGLPNSSRLMDPTQPQYAMTGFTQIDPFTGNPAVVFNDIANFKWEYVWHCHILGHEENDFMRAVAFDAMEPLPAAPTLTNAKVTPSGAGQPAGALGTNVTITWTDNANTEYQFVIERATVTNGTPDTFAKVGTALANATSFVDTTLPAEGFYQYRVTAVGAAGNAVSNPLDATYGALPAAPTGLLATPASPCPAQGACSVNLTWTDAATNETSYKVEYSLDGANWTLVTGTLPANSTSFTVTGLQTLTAYQFRVSAVNLIGANPATTAATTADFVPAAPAGLMATALAPCVAQDSCAVALAWTDAAVNETGYLIEYSQDGIAWTLATTLPANASSYTVGGLHGSTTYQFRVTAVNSAGGNFSTISAMTAPVSILAAPTGLAAQMTASNVVQLTFTDQSIAETAYQVEAQVNAGPWTPITTGVVWSGVPSASTGSAMATVAGSFSAGNVYTFRVSALAGATAGPISNLATLSLAVAPQAPSGVTAAAGTAGSSQIMLKWTDAANNNASYTIQQRNRSNALNAWSGWTTVTTAVAGNATSYTATLTSGRQYQLRVQAVNGMGVSLWVQAPSGTGYITAP